MNFYLSQICKLVFSNLQDCSYLVFRYVSYVVMGCKLFLFQYQITLVNVRSTRWKGLIGSRHHHLNPGRLMKENMQLNLNILTKISAQEWKESNITFEDYFRIISYFFVYKNFALFPSLGLFFSFSFFIFLPVFCLKST